MKSKTQTNSMPTQSQQNSRNRFRDAARHAKQLLLDPERKSYYTDQARSQRLPNAYVAAVTEYLRTTPSTPLIQLIGSVKRALQIPAKQTQQTKTLAIKPKSTPKPATTYELKPHKKGKRNVMAVYQIPGLTLGIACSGNITTGKMKARKSKSGDITFGTTFYFD